MNYVKPILIFCLIAPPQLIRTASANEHHPRLFLSTEKVGELRAAIGVKGSHHAEAFGALKSWVDQKGRQPFDPSSGNWNYGRAYMARAAALVAVITGREEYAGLAFTVLKDVHDRPDRDKRLPDRIKTYGLAKATVGEGFALAYDWCYDMWNQQQRDYIKDVLKRSLDAWPKYSHSQLQVDRGSNWAAVCRGAELVMLLASYEDLNRPERLRYLKNQLARHMAITYGPGGLSQEGIGYTGYGGTYLLEACYALAQTGDNKLVDELAKHAFWKLQMFTGSSLITSSFQRRYLQQGVSGTAINDEGWVSQAISSVPEDRLPYFGWFYDRQMGRFAPGSPEQKYDNDRAAWVWALVHYPPGLVTKDPTGVMDCWHFDKKTGGYFFRNRWRDEDDILCAIYSDLANHKAWDKREATGIRLIAHGTAFFGGPSKSKTAKLHSRLLLNGKADAGKNSGKNGRHILAEGNENGGYVIVGGGDTYESLGVDDMKRHLLVDFSPEKNSALLSTLDRVRSSKSRTYTWNANLGDDRGDDGIEASTGTEDGRGTFLLEGRNGWVKGWVLHPADSTIRAGDPLQIETTSANADIWIVMITGQGAPPAGRVSGKGLESTLEIGDAVVRYDGQGNRIVAEERNVRKIPVAKGLASHPVNGGRCLISDGEYQYIAFYDGDHVMTVGKRKLGEAHWDFAKLPERVGWDTHNKIVLFRDRAGHLHVTGNMHCAPLRYYRTGKPGDIHTFEGIHTWTGDYENRVTYPTVFKLRDGSVYLMYRHGGSGNGMRILLHYDEQTQKWTKATPILTNGMNRKPTCNAYPIGLLEDKRGRWHIAWCWRETPDVITNFDICYAKSTDRGATWKGWNGRELDLPITPENAHVVEDIEQDNGLMNGGSFAVDNQGRPYIGYTRFDNNGYNQLYIATPVDGEWKVVQLTDWKHRFYFSGRGTIPESPPTPRVSITEDQKIRVTYSNRHAKIPRGQMLLTRQQLLTGKPGDYTVEPTAKDGPKIPDIRAVNRGPLPRGVKHYMQQQTNSPNRDRKPKEARKPTMIYVVEVKNGR